MRSQNCDFWSFRLEYKFFVFFVENWQKSLEHRGIMTFLANINCSWSISYDKMQKSRLLVFLCRIQFLVFSAKKMTKISRTPPNHDFSWPNLNCPWSITYGKMQKSGFLRNFFFDHFLSTIAIPYRVRVRVRVTV